jgi:hypothetical protein
MSELVFIQSSNFLLKEIILLNSDEIILHLYLLIHTNKNLQSLDQFIAFDFLVFSNLSSLRPYLVSMSRSFIIVLFSTHN